MDALDVMKVCLRRWYVMLAVILIAAGAGIGLVRDQQPVYTAYGNYALVYTQAQDLSPNEPDPRSANPLGGENGALLAEALEDELMSMEQQRSRASFGTRGYGPGTPATGATFSASMPQYSKSYVVQAWGPDPRAVRDIVSSVLDDTAGIAQEIQDRAGAPRESQYTTFTTSPVQVTQLPPSSKIKLLAAIAGIGLIAGAALSLLVDRLATRRRARAAQKRTDDDDDEIEGLAAGGRGSGKRAAPRMAPGTSNGTSRTLHEVEVEPEATGQEQDASRSRGLLRVR
ncbi:MULTISPECIES: hypothetical protein [unclassified Nocardioides]|uniref:hypothetical protein n=1 Tax=unclassified Nocardioides TaxID=2615069 RepID=UPI0036222058